MKQEDFRQVPSAIFRSTGERMRFSAEQGIEILVAIQRHLRELFRLGVVDQIKAELHQKVQNRFDASHWHRAIDDAFAKPDVAASIGAFAQQLKIINRDIDNALPPDASEHLRQNLAEQLHRDTRWAQFGLNTFNLTDSLAASLILTEPLPLTEETFALPFPTFAVTVPNGFIPFFRGGKQEWARNVWVHRFDSPETPGLQIYQVTVECGGDSDLAVFRREPLDRLIQFTTEVLKSFDDDPEFTSDDNATMAAALRIVRNLVLWIDAHPLPPREERKGKSKKSRKHEPKDRIAPYIWILGHEVKLGRELRTMATEMVLGQTERSALPGWKVRVQHVVRGHWKQQPHGPERSLRKRISVEPYWRGPEGAAAWSHVYQPMKIEK